MTATSSQKLATSQKTSAHGGSIEASLLDLERLLGDLVKDDLEACDFDSVGQVLRELHARVRVHHAANCLSTLSETSGDIPLEYSEPLHKLREEHTTILGMLDRIVRSVDSMADQSMEDKEVFLMCVRELIAVIRRHEAQENRILCLTLWRDTGGEC